MENRKIRRLLMTAVFVLAAAAAAASGARQRSQVHAAEQAVVRFHIRANSDSQEDQKLKMEVKDAVAEMLSSLLANARTKEETEQILESSLDDIELCARNAVEENGSRDDVEVFWGESVYPEKHWGDVSLPAGRYESLIVRIGEGKGHNWWCMLYPLLGFSDILSIEQESGAEKVLEESLPDAVREVMLHPDRVKLKFRWLG